VGFQENLQPDKRIPVTFKHFKLLARLGRSINPNLFDDIEAGAEFYFSEEDYLSPEELHGSPRKMRKRKHTRIRIRMVSEYSVKKEETPGPSVIPTASSSSSAAFEATPSSPGPSNPRKRPRRNAASSAKNYVVPDSDDDEIADENDEMVQCVHAHVKQRKEESNLQKWIKHLSVLLKEEQKKYKEKKKTVQAAAEPGTKIRMTRNDFQRSLAYYLQRLRKTDRDKRLQLYGPDVPDEDYSSGEDDEYHERTTRSKRRKVV